MGGSALGPGLRTVQCPPRQGRRLYRRPRAPHSRRRADPVPIHRRAQRRYRADPGNETRTSPDGPDARTPEAAPDGTGTMDRHARGRGTGDRSELPAAEPRKQGARCSLSLSRQSSRDRGSAQGDREDAHRGRQELTSAIRGFRLLGGFDQVDLRLSVLFGREIFALLSIQQRRHRVQMAAHVGRQHLIETLNLSDLFERCLANSLQAAKVPQQSPPAHGPYSFYIVQHRSHPRPSAQLAVEGNGEPMCLVADAHEEKERGRVLRQHDRILAIGQKYPLLRLRDFFLAPIVEHVLFGERDAIDLIEQALLAQNLKCHIKLPLAAINYPQIRVFVLAPGALGAARQHFGKARKVVLALEASNPVAAIKVSLRLAFVEGDLRPYHHRTLQIRDVVAFDALGRVAQVKPGAKLLEHLLTGIFVVAPRLEALPRILHRHLEQAQLLSALRHNYIGLF